MTTELTIQTQVADYLRLRYPSVIFHSDFGSGIKLTPGQAIKQKRLQGGHRAWPDMFIAEPRNGKHGLFIELKRDGVKIYTKKGPLVADNHIREQFDMLADLRQRGYEAQFACGFDAAVELIDSYLGGPAEKVEF